MLKAMGALLVVLGCSGLGWYGAMRHSVRISLLRELEQILQFLYGEISYSGCDMVEMMGKLALKGGRYREFFLAMQEDLKGFYGKRFGIYWKEEISRIQGWEYFQTEDLEVLCRMGENLGNMDRDSQLETLHMFQERVEEIRQRAVEEYHGKARICTVAGTTAGAFLAILLL